MTEYQWFIVELGRWEIKMDTDNDSHVMDMLKKVRWVEWEDFRHGSQAAWQDHQAGSALYELMKKEGGADEQGHEI